MCVFQFITSLYSSVSANLAKSEDSTQPVVYRHFVLIVNGCIIITSTSQVVIKQTSGHSSHQPLCAYPRQKVTAGVCLCPAASVQQLWQTCRRRLCIYNCITDEWRDQQHDVTRAQSDAVNLLSGGTVTSVCHRNLEKFEGINCGYFNNATKSINDRLRPSNTVRLCIVTKNVVC